MLMEKNFDISVYPNNPFTTPTKGYKSSSWWLRVDLHSLLSTLPLTFSFQSCNQSTLWSVHPSQALSTCTQKPQSYPSTIYCRFLPQLSQQTPYHFLTRTDPLNHALEFFICLFNNLYAYLFVLRISILTLENFKSKFNY